MLITFAVITGIALVIGAALWWGTSGPPNDHPDERWVGFTGMGGGGGFEDDPWRGIEGPSPEDLERADGERP